MALTDTSKVTINAFAEVSLPNGSHREPFRCDLSSNADGGWVGGVDLHPDDTPPPTSAAADPQAQEGGSRRTPASPAKNLAIIETQDREPPQSDVADFDIILTRLDRHCTESKSGVSDVIVNMQRELRRRGYERTLRQVGAMLIETVPEQSTTSCAEVGAVDIMLLQQFGD